jgi:endogenous inhibitor of DNA gyrase (YacG/DUF329 family)
MNYKLKCPGCNETVKVSTRNAVKYKDEKSITFSFDCPKCETEIIAKKEYPI